MWLLYTICILLCVAYCCIIIAYRIWFKRLKPFQPSNTATPYCFFSVIIPARNEAANITNCLQSIITNNYPQTHYEVIVIDDFSTGAGGMVQAMLNGFGGLEITPTGITQLKTKLPFNWKSLTLTGIGVDKKTYVVK